MNAPLSEQQLAEIRAREAAASKGPWCTDGAEIYQGDEYLPGLSEWIGETCRADEGDGGKADAAFVAAARSDVPALLAEVERQAREIERLTAELAKYVGHEPTLAEEAQYRHEAQVRYAAALEAQICQCEPQCEGGEYLHAADCPVVPIQMQAFDVAGGAS